MPTIADLLIEDGIQQGIQQNIREAVICTGWTTAEKMNIERHNIECSMKEEEKNL